MFWLQTAVIALLCVLLCFALVRHLPPALEALRDRREGDAERLEAERCRRIIRGLNARGYYVFDWGPDHTKSGMWEASIYADGRLNVSTGETRLEALQQLDARFAGEHFA